jgi:Tol biopolymer transport system component
MLRAMSFVSLATRGAKAPDRRAIRALLFVGLGLLGACTVAGSARPAEAGEIAYVATKGKILVINADGTGRRQLVSGVADDLFNWSPDGQFIAYIAGAWSRSVAHSVIRLVDANGVLVRKLQIKGLSTIYGPSWSPDASHLAFTGWDRHHLQLNIYVVNADGTGLRRLTHAPRGLFDEDPDWSPDGAWIAFQRLKSAGARSQVVAVRPDGTDLHRVATVITGPQCACPDWSPDNSKIAYQASPSAATSRFPEIYLMNADGSGQTQLTHNRARDENPDWSPDGQKIAFYSERWGNAENAIIDANGKNLRRVTRDPWYAALPRWRPSG